MKFFTLISISLLIGLSNCITTEELFPYGLIDDRLSSESDDVSSPEIQLKVPIVFYETIYKSIFVNDNGILSFQTEVPSFFNSQFPLSYPIIAPMYSDVDIRKSGAVYYRETNAKELLDRANQEIVRHFSSAAQFRAQTLFISTWSVAGRYNQKSSPTNTAQVVIATNGTDSYAFFLYPENAIKWIQGDGKITNLPDARTQAGFMSGDGRFHNLQGSGTEQIRNFDKMSNVFRPGVWLFKIGNLRSGNIIDPDIDGDRNLAKQGADTCATAQLPCPPTAKCNDYRNGFCCSCVDGYFGNGRECLMINQPLRMTGKVRANINDVNIDGADLHTYVATDEGRSYTAISRIPSNIGSDMQTLYTLGSVVGWLFASTKSGAPNGFMLTGGIFNRTARVEFPQTGHQIDIRETFLGPDVFNFLRVEVEIRGSLPEVPLKSKVEVEDYNQQFTRIRAGVIRSHSTHSFKFGENSLNVPIIIEQTIEFNECQYKTFDERQSTLQLTVARNYIVYDNNDQIVRYASTSKTSNYNLSGDDPCRTGRAQCGEHSSCVVEELNFKCICDRGYENDFREEAFQSQNALNVANCVDINECTSARSNCHEFATCINIPGSYSCQCNPGYSGNGYQCQKELNCEDIKCDPNADCINSERIKPECRCKSGFVGDGRICTKTSREPNWEPNGNSESEDCRNYNLCDINAECKANPLTRRHQCFCRPGYRGDGIVCIEESESCELLNNCGSNAECISDAESNNAYYCACNPGYVGDGYTCLTQLNPQSCDQINSCDSNAQCIYKPSTSQYLCQCSDGFVGDGYQCSRSSGEITCDEQSDVCSPNAECLTDSLRQKSVCQCKTGFRGDGVICYPNNECDANSNTCDRNARCVHNSGSNRYECRCNNGYSGDGKQCVANEEATCDLIYNCHPNATCAFDLNIQKHTCQCNTGFRGDGKTCKQHILSCNLVNNCDIRAECKYNFDAQGYRCQCNDGFIGDGFNCRPLRTCREDQSLCDRNADCQYVEQLLTHVCHCRYGFIGDGFQCSSAPRHDGDYLLFTQGMSLLRIPLQPTKEDKGRLLLTKPHQIPAGLDVDCYNGLVYWSDVAHGVIYRALYNGSSVETVIEGVLRSPEGIAIDWVSRNIYWTDSLKDTIEVSKLDGKMHKTLINEGLGDPRGIVVHPGSGKMYWSDWNRDGPKIEVANLDGTGRQVLVTTDLGLPNNLAIDYDRNDLCWTDAGLHRIECIDLYSNSRRIVHTPTAYPFDLTINGNSIYWTDWEIKFIQKVDRNGGNPEPMELPLGGNGKVYSIITVPRHCPRISNACSVNNGGCRHLCLPNNRGRTCLCPDSDDADSCNQIVPQ